MTRNQNGEFAKDHTLRSFILSVIAVAILVAIGLWYHFTHPIIETKTVQVTVIATSSTPVIDRIEKCESNNSQFDKNGQVLMMANQNGSVDVGIMQINVRLWGAQASKLGYDLTKQVDNEAFGHWLYANYGTEPWVYSKPCWTK